MARDDVRSWVQSHRVASFFVLTYALTWLAWLPAILGYGGDLNRILSLIAQFGPAVAALVVTWYSGASVRGWARSIIRWRVAPWWYAVAVGLPIVLIGVEGAIFGLLGHPTDPSLVSGSLAAYLPTLVFLTLIAGLGEEPGWRGFALPRLETRYAPVAATLLLGLLWALWHLPLVLVDPRFPHGFTSLAPLVLLALLTLLGIVFMAFFYTWVYNGTRSVLLCMLLHGSFNTATGAFPVPFEVLQREVYVTLLIVQDVTLLVALVILIGATRGRLGYDAAPQRDPEDMQYQAETDEK